MKKICLILCLFISTIAQAKIIAHFTPNPVKHGDAVELIFASDTAFSNVPNIDVLQKDFVIGGQQRRQSSQWINGKGSNTYQLIYTLFPNKSGDISVQGLKIGSETIPPLTLSVRPNAQYAPTGNVVISVECPNVTLYPSQKTLCQVYLDDSVGLVEGQIIAPQTDAGTWEQVMAPVPVTSLKSGVDRYQSTFAFTPKKSGTLTIDPFVFQGEARFDTRPKNKINSIFDFMVAGIQSIATRPIGAQSKPVTLRVKDKPQNYQGWWLPSTNVTLTETYQMPNTIAVGEPILRTVTLTAKDVMSADLPVPSAPNTNGLKIYANPEQRQDTAAGGQVAVTMTFVPTQGGDITLPAIRVPWFDPVSEKTKYASVPAKKIFVTGDVVSTPPPPVLVEPTQQQPVQQPQLIQPQTNTVSPLTLWIWIAVAVGVSFLLGLLVALFFIKRSHSSDHKKKKPLPDLYPF